jgi:topoisomerase-4 subunit B
MNPSQLRETTIAPDSRRLVQLTITDEPGAGEQKNNPARENSESSSASSESERSPDSRAADNPRTSEKQEDVFQVMDMLLSKKRARDRKRWIETHGVIKEI